MQERLAHGGGFPVSGGGAGEGLFHRGRGVLVVVVRAEGVEPVQVAHDEPATGLVGREDFQLVAFREAVAAQEVEVVRVAGDDVRDVHGLLFVAVVGGGLLRLGEVEARAVGAVGDGQKLVSHLIGRFAVKHAAIGAHDCSHVERLLVAALDLDGIDSRISQRLQVRKHVKIFRVHNEGAAVVLLNGKEFAGPLFLFQKELHGSPRRELRRGGL